MSSREELLSDLQNLVNKAFSYAGSVDLGGERVQAFEFAEVLRRMQRQGVAQTMLAATNPFNFSSDDAEDWDEDDE